MRLLQDMSREEEYEKEKKYAKGCKAGASPVLCCPDEAAHMRFFQNGGSGKVYGNVDDTFYNQSR